MSSKTLIEEALIQGRIKKSLVTESAIASGAPHLFGPLPLGTYLLKCTVQARIDHGDSSAAAAADAGWICEAGAVYPLRCTQDDERYVSVIAVSTAGISQLLRLVTD